MLIKVNWFRTREWDAISDYPMCRTSSLNPLSNGKLLISLQNYQDIKKSSELSKLLFQNEKSKISTIWRESVEAQFSDLSLWLVKMSWM